MADSEAMGKLGDQLFSRTAGAPLVSGNAVRLLRDAAENYPAWLDAIRKARRAVHFENYIIHDDDAGQRFSTAFIEKARESVPVRVVYDWFGSLGKASGGFWRRLREVGWTSGATTRRAWTSRWAGLGVTTASASWSTTRWRSSPDSAWAGCGGRAGARPACLA